MSTSIRPGGPAAGTPGTARVEGPSETAATSASSAVNQAGAVAATQTAPVQGPTAALLSRLDAGEVTREQAIEGLVAEALKTHGGARLPAAQRVELEAVLRAALAEDPALASLLG